MKQGRDHVNVTSSRLLGWLPMPPGWVLFASCRLHHPFDEPRPLPPRPQRQAKRRPQPPPPDPPPPPSSPRLHQGRTMAPPTPTKLANLAINTNHGTNNISGPSSARPNLSVNVDRSDTHSLAPSVGASSFWSDKKLPRLPKRKWVLGAYDNKLVSGPDDKGGQHLAPTPYHVVC